MPGHCRRCGEYLIRQNRGPAPEYCSTRCRVAAHRARKQLPIELTSRPTWTRRAHKRPVQINGKPASSTNPATWSTYAEVLASKVGTGFGIMLGDGLGCYDLDHCLDGDTLSSTASDLLATLDPIWIERSMSGDGLHIFAATDATKGYKRGGVEFYPRSRFIAVTGDHFTP